MKYGTSLIVVSIINGITIFSGLPTSWKKTVITLASLFVLSVGLILHAKSVQKAALTKQRSKKVQELVSEEMNDLVEEITEDVTHQVEEEIDRI